MRDDAGPPDDASSLRWTLVMCAFVIGATTLLSAALTAALREKWAMLPLVFAGAITIVLTYLWHWRRILFRRDVRLPPGDTRRQEVIVTAVAELVTSLAVLLFLGWSIVLGTRNERVRPCLCADQAGLNVWLNLVAGAIVLTIFVAAGLLVMAHAVYRFAYRLRR